MRKYLKIGVGLIRLLKEEILNGFCIKIQGISYCINSGVKFWIHDKGSCVLGKKNWFSENCIIECSGGILKIGHNNFFNSNCRITAVESIEIGDNNLFGPNVIIVDHDHRFDNSDVLICKQGLKSNSVKIKSDVWVGGNVTICAGAEISNHIVIAANSVVKGKLIEPGVDVGSPAKLVKKGEQK